MDDLPSVEQCHEFHRVINEGRKGAGLKPLEFLEFDEAKPDDPTKCLSATNLFAMAGYRVLDFSLVSSADPEPGSLGILRDRDDLGWAIPSEILAVTNPFDGCDKGGKRHEALRARLVEAGVVAP